MKVRWLVVVVAVAVGCNSQGGDGGPVLTVGSGSAGKKGSASGFSAGLSSDLAASGSGSGSGSATPIPTPGSGSRPASGSGSGSGSVQVDAAVVVDAAAAVAAITPDAAAPADSGTGSGSGSATGSGSAVVVDAGAIDAPSIHHPPNVAVSPDLAAIKLDLLDGWDRDIDEAGTLRTTYQHGAETSVFVFRYGYEDAKAPVDRDQYKTWLAAQQLLTVTMDRQRGAAWYLEGTDGKGAPAFRVLVNYGGKHLICYGSLYKDPDSSKLGKPRDEIVIAAKKICSSLSL